MSVNKKITAGEKLRVRNNKIISIKICHVNVQGFLNNHSSIELFLKTNNIDILCVSEHWMREDMNNFHFGNYGIASAYARKSHIHGGTLILNRLGFEVTDVQSIRNLSIECEVELCAASLKISGYKLIIISGYRPPSGNINIFIDCLSQALHRASDCSKNIIFHTSSSCIHSNISPYS